MNSQREFVLIKTGHCIFQMKEKMVMEKSISLHGIVNLKNNKNG